MTPSLGGPASSTMAGARNLDGSPLTAQQIQKVVDYLESPGSGLDQSTSFRDFVTERVAQNPPRLPDGAGYIAYSGVDSNGISNALSANEYVRTKNGASGLIGDTPWGRYIQSIDADNEINVMARKLQAFLEQEGVQPFNADYPASLRDVMWNAGSGPYFENAMRSCRPVIAFVENAPNNRGFSRFELPVALEHPEAVVNGYPTRAFGAADTALEFASRSAAEYQSLERSIAEAATRNSGREISVADIRKNLDLAGGYSAVNKTIFDIPKKSFEEFDLESMKSTGERWSAISAGGRSMRVDNAEVSRPREAELDARGHRVSPNLPNKETILRPHGVSEPTFPSARGIGRVAGVAGLSVAAAYDAKETGERIGTALAQDNPTGAQSEATRYLARGLGGAAAVLTPAAAGMGGGPAVALAVADAYLLTQAFDRGAQYLGVRKITHQTDRDGVQWEYTGRQWLRDDLKADLRVDAVAQENRQTFSALPDKARELNYLASVEAVSQAIGKADARNPYELPASASDAPSNQPSP